MWTAIAAGIGMLTTILAWIINPSRKRTEELNKIFNELDKLYIERDKALEKNDSNALTSVVYRINLLRRKKDSLLQ